jgi:carbamoyltransferase
MKNSGPFVNNILGISAGGPSGAALFLNGELTFAVNEERLTGVKFDRTYPKNSINWCLNEAGLSPNDITTICYGFSNGIEQGKFISSLIQRIQDYSGDSESLKTIIERVSTESIVDAQQRENFYKETKSRFPQARIYACGHHQAHQACAYMGSPFKEALVVTSDGRGDFESFTISTANSMGINKIYNAFSWESLGYFYGRITHLCGFTPERHEGKILGLSAHGDPKKAKDLVNKMVELKEGKIHTFPGNYYRPFFTNYSKELKEETAKFSREDLAAAAQERLEEIVCEIVSDHVKKTKLKNICLAGGVFTNVRLNQKIRELPGVEDIFVYPNMGDDGICAGAVYHKLLNEDGFSSSPIKSLYLGPNLSNQTMFADLEKKGFKIEQIDKTETLYETIVNLLANEQVIALARGRAEFGPRALGNRSILLTPDSRKLSESLNNRLGRNDFMPFAPIIASNLAKKCLRDYNPSQFSSRHMVTTYNVTPEFQKNSPAVVHIDGSVRPQVVFKEDNHFLYELLNRWHQKTGKLSLINTSYNMHESPIASLEKDVISTFEANSVDCLLFPPFLAYQKGGNNSLR